MQKQAAVVEKIRKLLRTGKGTGAEAEVARRVASELMVKHGVSVSAEVHTCVASELENWQVVALTTCAKHFGCGAFHKGRDLRVEGDEQAVAFAVDLFKQTERVFTVQCCANWTRFSDTLRNMRNRERGFFISEKPMYSETDIQKAKKLFFTVFLNSAAFELKRRFPPLPRVKNRKMEFEKPDSKTVEIIEQEAPPVPSPPPSLADQAGMQITKEAIAVENVGIGTFLIETEAQRAGVTVVQGITEHRPGRLLTAASSFLKPPPPPSRFTYLDFD